MTTHGGRANKTGKTLESIVTPTLTSQYGFEVWDYLRYKKVLESKTELLAGELPKRLLIKRAPFTTLYGSKGTTEFLLRAENVHSTPEFPIANPPSQFICRIECKWQQSAGSVDEKFPYLYLSCVEAMTESNIIILHGGGKYRVGAIEWLKNAVQTRKYVTPEMPQKNIRVLGIEDFMKWVSNAFDRYSVL